MRALEHACQTSNLVSTATKLNSRLGDEFRQSHRFNGGSNGGETRHATATSSSVASDIFAHSVFNFDIIVPLGWEIRLYLWVSRHTFLNIVADRPWVLVHFRHQVAPRMHITDDVIFFCASMYTDSDASQGGSGVHSQPHSQAFEVFVTSECQQLGLVADDIDFLDLVDGATVHVHGQGELVDHHVFRDAFSVSREALLQLRWIVSVGGRILDVTLVPSYMLHGVPNGQCKMSNMPIETEGDG